MNGSDIWHFEAENLRASTEFATFSFPSAVMASSAPVETVLSL